MTELSARHLLGVVALLGFGLGCAALGARWSRPPAPVAGSAPAALSVADRAVLARALADEVRRSVAAAMPAAQVVVPAPAASTTPATPPSTADALAAAAPSPPSPALESARAVVQDAVARGSWRAEDTEALRAQLADLRGRDAEELLRELSRAINTGRVHIADPHRSVL
jgi:hypothetical protein